MVTKNVDMANQCQVTVCYNQCDNNQLVMYKWTGNLIISRLCNKLTGNVIQITKFIMAMMVL